MTLCIMISIFHTYRDEIKRFSQKYADRMEEYPNIPATNLMKEVKTIQKKIKRKLPQDLCT